MNRLISFFLKEQELRWKVYLICGGIAFGYALVNLFVLHRKEKRVSFEMVVVLFILIAVFVAVYIAKARGVAAETEKPNKAVGFSRGLIVAGAVAIAFLACMSAISAPVGRLILTRQVNHLPQFLRHAESSPERQKIALQVTAEVLHRALAEELLTDPLVITDVGNAIASIQANDPNEAPTALAALEELISYRSVQNVGLSPIASQPVADKTNWTISVGPDADHLEKENVRLIAPLVPADVAARYEILGEQRNAENKIGPSLLIISGIRNPIHLTLDGKWIRHVVLQDAVVTYKGGPLILDDVYFVHCVFRLHNSASTLGFVRATLSAPGVSFKTS